MEDFRLEDVELIAQLNIEKFSAVMIKKESFNRAMEIWRNSGPDGVIITPGTHELTIIGSEKVGVVKVKVELELQPETELKQIDTTKPISANPPSDVRFIVGKRREEDEH